MRTAWPSHRANEKTSRSANSRSDFRTAPIDLTAMDKTYAVYILTNDSGTLYVGVTSALEQRVTQHHLGLAAGFTKKYHLHCLVYYETTSDVHIALEREKQIKRWRREKKIALVRTANPNWRNLAIDLGIATST
jgi:putative endonuclease